MKKKHTTHHCILFFVSLEYHAARFVKLVFEFVELCKYTQNEANKLHEIRFLVLLFGNGKANDVMHKHVLPVE